MKRLITIILALVLTLITAPQKDADQPPVTAEKPPQAEITVQAEQVPEVSETTAETAFWGEESETGTEVNTEETTATESQVVTKETDIFTEEKTPTEREMVTEECIEITEEKVISELEEEIVECIDEGDQCLAEYKPQIGGNPIHSKMTHRPRLMIDRWSTTLAKVKTAPVKESTSKE